MILKIKKDEYAWLYAETNTFEIYHSCSSKYLPQPNPNNDLICIERPFKEENHENEFTLIIADKVNIYCIDEFEGFVLNDKGQTIERL